MFCCWFILAFTTGQAPTTAWPSGMATDYNAGRKPPAISARVLHRAKKHLQRSKLVVHSDNVVAGDVKAFVAQREEMARKSSFAVSDSLNWINLGDFRSAEVPLEAFLTNVDAYDPRVVKKLADLYFRNKETGKAYVLLAPFATGDGDRDILARAALAASLAGLAYEGQRQFLLGYLAESRMFDTSEVPAGQTPVALRVLADLGLGMSLASNVQLDNAVPYFTDALNQDPGNPIAAEWLGGYYNQNREWVKARDALRGGLLRASDATRQRIVGQLSVCEMHLRT